MSQLERRLYVIRDSAEAPPLPAVDTEAEPVLEGRVLPKEPGTRTKPQVKFVGTVAKVAKSPRVQAGARGTAGVVVTIGQGMRSWTVRAWDGVTYGVYRRQIRAAEAMGDPALLAEWVERKQRAQAERSARLASLPGTALGLAKFAGGAAAGAGGLVLVVSIGVGVAGVGEPSAVIHGVVEVIRGIAGVVSFALSTVPFVAPFALGWAAWREGRRYGVTPAWLASVTGRHDSDGAPITPSIVVTALRDLGIAPLRQAIKAMGDAGAAMLGPIRIAGCGVEVDVTLPSGVSTEEVQKKRRKLAENLGRHEHELFITIPAAARTVRLWIADSGALDEPIGPSPLVTDPDIKADYESGRAPWGQDLRGDAASISLYQRHLLITGLSNQGKTAALRALALWLAFDLKVRFRIADLKGAGDWDMFDGLAEVLIQGPTDEHVARATRMVEWGVGEMERRLQAPPGSKFDPVILIVDEAQVAFMCPAKDEDGVPYGGTKATSRYFMAARKIHNQGRAVDVLLWEGTQDPTDQNLPKLVREGAHIRASLAVGTESQSRMALGDKAVDGGASPHLLRQGLDKGTLVSNGEGVKLPRGQSSLTIRTHFIDTPEAAEVADQAKTRRSRVTTLDSAAPEETRDLLEDLDAVMGAEDIRAADLPALLARHAPRWAPYRTLTGKELVAQLAELGVKVPSTGNRWPVSRELISEALARRAAAGEDDAS